MHDWIAFTCLLGAVALLLALSAIDLKTCLLPNKLVAPFAFLAIIFHIGLNWPSFQGLRGWEGLSPLQIASGALLGGGILFAIRLVANHLYKTDTLGLGDVKLMAAAGLWLGPDGVLLALIIGALCGMIHGLTAGLHTAAKTKQKLDLNRLQVPAGPGFALGIVAMFLYYYGKLFLVFIGIWPSPGLYPT